MDTADAHPLGETVAVDGAEITVAAPEKGLFSSDVVNPPRLGDRKVEGYTGVGVKHLVVVLRNTSVSPMSLPDPEDLDFPSLVGREDAIEHHYTHRGETRTSLLRLLAERDSLNGGETVHGLLTHTYAYGLFAGDETAPISSPNSEDATAEAPDPLELTITPPGAEESTTLRWNPSQYTVSPRVSMTPRPPGADEEEATAHASDGSESFPPFCSECHANLDRYEEPRYCPQCGSKVATEEMALRGAKWWGAVVSGKTRSPSFEDDHPLSVTEFEELVSLLEVADDEVRTYAAHALAEYPFDPLHPGDRLDIAIGALPTLVKQARDRPWSAEAELNAILTVVEAAFSDQDRIAAQNLVPEVMGLFDAASEDARGDKYIPDVYDRSEEYGFLRLLEELSTVSPERVRPAVSEVVAALERELDRDNVPEKSTSCELCGKRHKLDRAAFVESAAGFLATHAEEDPEAVSAAVPSLIELLDPEGSTRSWGMVGDGCERTVSELLATLSEHAPDDVAAGREVYLRVAGHGDLPIAPYEDIVVSEYPQVRERIAELLATLVCEGAMEPTVITEGLRSENGPYLETMTQAATDLAESDPNLLSASIPDLIALLDFEEFHYTICGAAATALGHLDATEAVEPLCDLYAAYTDIDSEDLLGTDIIIQPRVAKALDRIEAVPVRVESGVEASEEPICASCGQDLDDYGLPEWCPSCGTKIY